MKKNKKAGKTRPPPAQVTCPKAPTSMWINSAALGFSLLSVWCLRELGQGLETRTQSVIVCLALALPIIVFEWLFLKPWRNPSTGLDFNRRNPGSGSRVAVKLLGFYVCVGSVSAGYWLFPEYHGPFYNDYFAVLKAVLPWWMLLAIPYFYLVDRHMLKPRDGYWQLGSWLLGNRREANGRVISQLFLGWLVKLFFLPLMFVYLGNNLSVLVNVDFSLLTTSFKEAFDVLYYFLFYIDLLFVTVGYACTFRVLDSHIRSVEPSFLGWSVALIAYQPFWGLFHGNYLKYDESPGWGYWFWDTPLMYGIWGGAILLSLGLYAWASIPFGIRFSNLTHRGILTNGPFRYTKHPGYISKNLSWWMISMPFMVSASASAALRLSLLLLLVNFLYFMRARTEERHLSRDATYVAYARYIEEHGLFAFLGRWFPILRFKPGCLLNTNGGASVQATEDGDLYGPAAQQDLRP